MCRTACPCDLQVFLQQKIAVRIHFGVDFNLFRLVRCGFIACLHGMTFMHLCELGFAEHYCSSTTHLAFQLAFYDACVSNFRFVLLCAHVSKIAGLGIVLCASDASDSHCFVHNWAGLQCVSFARAVVCA